MNSGSGFGDSVFAGRTRSTADRAAVRAVAVLGHFERAALHGLRDFRQAAFGQRERALGAARSPQPAISATANASATRGRARAMGADGSKAPRAADRVTVG